MFRKTLIALVVSMLMGASMAQAAEPAFDRVMASKTINCGYFLWPPYLAKDANTGKLSGMSYEVMEMIAKNMGFKLNWSAEIGVGDAVAALESNKIDAVCISVWPSPARLQSLSLSIPTFYSVAYAFVRSDDKRFDGDLNKANKKEVHVAAIDGDYTHDLAEEKLPQASITALSQMVSGSELLMQLMTKKADIVFSDEGLVNDFMKNNPGALRKVANIPPVRIYGETIAVRRGEYQLKNMIDMAINQLVNDGMIEASVDRFVKEYQTEFFAPAKTFIRK